jgi:hypothetical protein
MAKKIGGELRRNLEYIFPDKPAPGTAVMIPSITMDEEILLNVSSINHYEERLLCMLMLLRMPRTMGYMNYKLDHYPTSPLVVLLRISA